MALAATFSVGGQTLAQNVAVPKGPSLDPSSHNSPLSTEDRLGAPGWWPTKGDRPRSEYLGPAVCLSCHELKDTYKDSAMFHAAVHAANAGSLHEAQDRLTFKIGAYTYRITNAHGRPTLKVSKGAASDSAVLLWAFGMGRIAQTYVYEENGRLRESHLSFYTALQGLDITPGHPRTEPPSLDEAAGRLVPDKEIRRCFGCHTTASTTKSGFDPRTPFPGVTCEACHGPGARHVAAMKSGNYDAGVRAILNPLQLHPVASVDFCGACHRTSRDVELDSPVRRATLNVRFQPYRLENSRCWKEGKGDARITCLSCHDPHLPLATDPASYDSTCMHCHRAAGAEAKETRADKSIHEADTGINKDDERTACPVGVKLCVTCHMPKFKNPLLHTTFTDHWIRIAPPGAPLPD
jgi:hypothetical protein